VDEARLSGNFYEWTNDEQKALIGNYDAKSVTLPPMSSEEDSYAKLDFYRTEMFLF